MILGLGYNTLILYMLFPLTPIILDRINPLNEPRPKEPLLMVEFFIDQDKYYYTILAHAYVVALASILTLFAPDLLFFSCVQHTCGMFAILK